MTILRLPEKEQALAALFMQRHGVVHSYTYLVTPTALGEKLEIRCNECGEIEDLTDYEAF